MKKSFFLFIITFVLSACGSDLGYPSAIATQSAPALLQIIPTSAAPGDTVAVYGLGFSVIPAANVLFLGETEIAASAYALNEDDALEAPEVLSFVLPDDIVADDYTVSLFVNYDNGNGVSTSSNLNLTVTP